MTCWHCNDSNACNCISCGHAERSGWIAGECGWCKARSFHERHKAVLDTYSTTDRKNWEFHPPADGNKGYRIFIPFKGLE